MDLIDMGDITTNVVDLQYVANNVGMKINTIKMFQYFNEQQSGNRDIVFTEKYAAKQNGKWDNSLNCISNIIDNYISANRWRGCNGYKP